MSNSKQWLRDTLVCKKVDCDLIEPKPAQRLYSVAWHRTTSLGLIQALSTAVHLV